MIPITHHRVLALVFAWLAACLGFVPAARSAPERQLLAHYLPWYGTQEVSGRWGWHWTMGHFDPERIRADGTRPAAAHDPPLIGLYDSGDPRVLECQVLLMKLAGITGVIIDWYGTDDFNDYATIHRNAETLIPFLRKAGLRFAICYEDQSIRHLLKAGAIPPAAALARGKLALRWLDAHWFGNDAYVKLAGRPVLLVFGPQHFDRAQWQELRAGLASPPMIFALPHRVQDSGADGAFGWPPATAGRSLTPPQWQAELSTLARRQAAGESVIPVVFPGFHDIYQQAGLHASYGHIDERGGATLAETLDLALASDAPLVQIATWNDYGEGTVVEPTRQAGYRSLEMIQQRSAAITRAPARFTATDLRLPVQLYLLRRRGGADARINSELDRAAEFLFASRCAPADHLLRSVAAQLGNQAPP